MIFSVSKNECMTERTNGYGPELHVCEESRNTFFSCVDDTLVRTFFHWMESCTNILAHDGRAHKPRWRCARVHLIWQNFAGVDCGSGCISKWILACVRQIIMWTSKLPMAGHLARQSSSEAYTRRTTNWRHFIQCCTRMWRSLLLARHHSVRSHNTHAHAQWGCMDTSLSHQFASWTAFVAPISRRQLSTATFLLDTTTTYPDWK